MKHILLLEPKLSEAEQLAEQIESAGAYAVTRVRNMREACASLAAQPQDLALIPISRNDSLVYSLRVLQPGLPLYLMPDSPQAFIPERQLQAVQGVVERPLILRALPHLLDGTWTAELASAQHQVLDVERLQLVLAELCADEQVRLALVVEGERVLASHTTAEASLEAAVLSRLARLPWAIRPNTTQLSFLNKVNGPENLLLMARPLGITQKLIVGAELNAGLTHLRQLGEEVVQKLADPTAEIALPRPAPNQYAIVWRGRQPVAEGLCTILQNVLGKIGQLYGCTIHHLEVVPDYVHMVLTVPPQRSSGWIAETFKRQSETLLARTLNISLPFWAEGYLARESAVPLSAVELKLFGDAGSGG